MPSLRNPPPGSSSPRRVRIWLDAHLPPGICPWLESRFEVVAEPVGDLGLRHAADAEIFFAARTAPRGPRLNPRRCDRPSRCGRASRGDLLSRLASPLASGSNSESEHHRLDATTSSEVLQEILQATRLLEKHPHLSVRDAVHAATALEAGIRTIISVDADFDRLLEIRRLPPEDVEGDPARQARQRHPPSSSATSTSSST